ncbi:MAG: hypothetical protein ACLUTA_16330 [Blautia wexlerae]
MSSLKNVNVNALNPAILQKFLSSGLVEEVDGFVQDYFTPSVRSLWDLWYSGTM